ncbi:MAG: glycosyltransferase family 39 protein [Patescibacteria group bacterium]
MRFNSTFNAWTISAAAFLVPLLSVTSVAFLLMALLQVRAPLLDEDWFLMLSVACASAGIALWQVFAPAHRLKGAVARIARIAFPALFAAALLFAVFPNDTYDEVSSYLLVVFVALTVIRFFPSADDEGILAGVPAFTLGPRLYAAIAALIVLLGIFLCAREAVLTPTLSVDEAHSSISASSILTRGLPYFPNTEVAYSRSWVNLYSIAASYALFGFDELSARLPSVVAYGALIILFFFLMRQLVSRNMALGALLLFAVNPWILHYGAYARMYIFILLFATAFAYLLVLYLNHKDKRVLYVLMPLAILLGVFSERTFLLFVPPYLLLVLSSFPRTRAFWKRLALYGMLPGLALAAAITAVWFQQIWTFVSRYVIGFNNGANPLANAQLQFIPIDWLTYFGVPAILLVLATTLIVLRGDLKARVFLALFWFAQVLVDVLIYSNFPARRFNYSFILVTLYAVVIALGVSLFLKLSHRLQGYTLAVFILGFSLYASIFTFSFPTYADFSTLRLAPAGSLVLGYPTSPMVFYNIKYDLHHDIRPFITDTVEMDKYVENGREIYSGGVFVTGVSELNDLRAERDVYIYYEKTRLDFLNRRTNDYIFANCEPLNEQVALDVAEAVRQKYQPTAEEYDTRNTMLILRCPQLPA